MSDTKKIRVVTVSGTCNAGLEEGDVFSLEGLRLRSEGNSKECCIALATLVMNLGRLRVQEGPLYVSCPDPGLGLGGNVIFEVFADGEA